MASNKYVKKYKSCIIAHANVRLSHFKYKDLHNIFFFYVNIKQG